MIYAATRNMAGLFDPWFRGIRSIDDLSLPRDTELLILTGGSDVNPARYGEINTDSDFPDNRRDRIEFSLLEQAIARGVHVIGVCRGLQLINIHLGGTLFQDMYKIGKDHGGRHKISWLKNTPMSVLYSVNSLHHQCINKLGGEEFSTVLGIEPKTETIEAVMWTPSTGSIILGVQFHPEMDRYIGDAVFKYAEELCQTSTTC